ncbi:MAG: hypothetical protein SPI86_09650 [Treponemataceae bacterium]|nr:hypothetical protein [Spirochaetales bacterium]MDY6032006.1 hypothetical protein [Treponemataceae bacterium]
MREVSLLNSKVNQNGSLTETLEAIEMAHQHGYTTVTSPALVKM